MKNKEEIINEFLNKDINKLDDFAPKVNNDKPFFQKTDFEVIEGIPKYFEPDELNRTSGGIAIISKYTLSILVEKHLKYLDPNGWTEKVNNSHIFQRCHCIAYRLSAKKNNKNNIFIGTDSLNKKIMNDVENEVEQYIRENEKDYIRILYRATPIYKNKNQIPTGILIEAKSLDTEFTLCRFCYNIKEKVKFRYSDGSITKDNRGIIKYVKKVKTSIEEKRQERTKNTNFVVNSQTKKYHMENCKILNNADPKYIKEITTKEKHLIDKGYFACKVCNNNIIEISKGQNELLNDPLN